jgi:hypothetical protein
MEHSLEYEIPSYTHDHFDYYKQLYQWYIDSENFRQELRAYYRDQPRHFDKWLIEKENNAAITSKF